MNIFKAFAADRVARGAAKDLVNGNGSGKPLGIVPSLIAAGINPVTVQGSASNTGGSEDATNSLGSKDVAALYYSVNEAYRVSPKAAFFMNDTTRTYLAQLVNKVGLPLMNWQGSEAFIYGKPVRISPSMDNIGAGKIPVLFGDGSYWLTRKAIDSMSYIVQVKEAAGLIEKGQVAYRLFCRMGGCLLWNDSGSPAPFGYLQNHT